METIKIAFVDFWRGFDVDSFILVQALRKRYNVEVTTLSEADYVFYSVFGDEHWFVPDEKIKIFYTGENVVPDFNACDYAFGFSWLDFGDRYMRLPNWYCTPRFATGAQQLEVRGGGVPVDVEALVAIKPDFCSFVVSNGDANPIRREMFDVLSRYRQVDSGGRYMNNVGGPVEDKAAFDRSHKFVIAFENSSTPGYTTEKIVDAFTAGCVPIYWGDPVVTRVFNPKSFVNVHDYPTLDAVVECVIRLDADADAYLDMLRQPALLHPGLDGYDAVYARVEAFMSHIVDQPLDSARRANREFWGRRWCDRERRLVERSRKDWKTLLRERLAGHLR